MDDHVRFLRKPELSNPTLIVGWSSDTSRLGARIADYLNNRLSGQDFLEIDPVDFFSLSGVTIEDDLVQFPESKFYAFPRSDLLVFKSSPPSYDWYRFLDLVLDFAQSYCHVKEIYTVGGMLSLAAHTAPRSVMGTFNSKEIKLALAAYGILGEWDYETPTGQTPTINSYLLWMAKRHNIPGVNLWVPVPFYLSATSDPRAEKSILEFLSLKLNLGLDLSDVVQEINNQNAIIEKARKNFPDVDNFISRLETNIKLSEEESQQLVNQIDELLRGEKI